MKARAAMVVLLVAAIVIAVVLLRARGPEPPPALAPRKPPASAESPREVVVSYLEALYQRDFARAYGYLSARSRQVHPYDEFVAQCEEVGVTVYDLAAVEAGPEEEGRVVVRVPLLEDPAEAGFTTVREAGGWRVVFIGGVPGFPYPEAVGP